MGKGKERFAEMGQYLWTVQKYLVKISENICCIEGGAQ